ncbi:serine--tRNA ligase [Candidatus Bathyarchaeota archaeon]|nr:serine--tRNA ligase [Candidatus Bathyarchaeota archaeon]
MLEIKFIREHPEIVKADFQRRGAIEKLSWVDELLQNDQNWRSLQSEANALRQQRNKLTEQIARLRKEGKDAAQVVREAESIPDRIREYEQQAGKLREEIDRILMQLPNVMHESVPTGKDENDNVEVRKWGTPPQLPFKPLDHIDLGLKLDLIDLERAAKVAGARFYYLKNELVRLNFALISYALDFIARKGYTIMQPPYLLRRDVLSGAVALSDFEETIYKIEDEDLYLIATSEHALNAYHFGEILDGKKLPLRYGGVSPCFRKEAGAHGRDTKGIFRVHQFEKVEQFVFSKPEDSWKEHEKLISNAEELYQALKLPYRVVNVCSGDLGTVAAKKYDLEVWLPGQGNYREAVSCSNCTSYQAVRSNVRYRDKTSDPTEYVHTLNSTFVATERTLLAIMENFQQSDGSIVIPEVLKPYMNGLDAIRVK